jgi:hypothetical protein
MKFSEWLVGAIIGLTALTLMPSGHVHAQSVAVTAADPSTALQGTTSLDVTVSGSGFDNSAEVNFLVTGTTNPGGITVKQVAVRGSKKLIATIDVSPDAVVNNFDIEVTLSGGRKGKGTTLFKVQASKRADVPEPVFAVGLLTGYAIDTGVMDFAGTYTTKLMPNDGGLNLPFWSEDGTEILVDSYDYTVPDRYVFRIFKVADPTQLRMVTLPGTIEEFSGKGSYAWSRHRADGCGNLLAKFRLQSASGGADSLWFMTTDGDNLATFLPLDVPRAPNASVYVKGWSGNGQRLLYAMVESGPDPDAGYAYVIDQLRISQVPTCLRSGSSIAFNPDSAPATVAFDLRMLIKSALATEGADFAFDYVWSEWHVANSDSSLVAMNVNVIDAKGASHYDLWLLDTRAGSPSVHRITGPGRPDTSSNVFAITWAPDDKEVAYLAENRRGKRIVNRLNIESCLASIDSGAGYTGCTATTVITKDIARLDWRPNWVRPAQ